MEEVILDCGVKSGNGLQGGIFVNDNLKQTVLIQRVPERYSNGFYPNYWDETKIGVLHYCGTNKGQTSDIKRQNLKFKLNKRGFGTPQLIF